MMLARASAVLRDILPVSPPGVFDGLSSKNEGTRAEQEGLALPETRVTLPQTDPPPPFEAHFPLPLVQVPADRVREEIGVRSREKAMVVKSETMLPVRMSVDDDYGIFGKDRWGSSGAAAASAFAC